MARVKKYAIRAVGHLIAHYERRQVLNKETGEMEYVKFGNRDIDTRWTPLNYRIWPPLQEDIAEVRDIFVSQKLQDYFDETNQDPEEPAMKRFRRIFRETSHAKRRDLACFCEWVMSLPDEIPCDRMEEFFDLCMCYCCMLYGAENIVGGWVHVDEDHRPHLHVAFVPVLTTTVTKDGETTTTKRICAKELLNRKHLSSWHGDLTALCQKEMGIENPGILNGRTVKEGGNRTVEQMKAHDRHYAKTKGKEVAEWRRTAEKALQGTERAGKTNSLDNLMVAAEDRKAAQLQEPRQRSLSEILKGR